MESVINRHLMQRKEAGKTPAEMALTRGLKVKWQFARQSRKGRGNSNMKSIEVRKLQRKVKSAVSRGW